MFCRSLLQETSSLFLSIGTSYLSNNIYNLSYLIETQGIKLATEFRRVQKLGNCVFSKYAMLNSIFQRHKIRRQTSPKRIRDTSAGLHTRWPRLLSLTGTRVKVTARRGYCPRKDIKITHRAASRVEINRVHSLKFHHHSNFKHQ